MPIYPSNLPPTVDTDLPFDKTLLTAGTSMDLITVPSGKTGRSFSLRNEGPGDAFIGFDDPATTSSYRVKNGESISETNVEISTKLTFVGEASKKPHVSGVLWV